MRGEGVSALSLSLSVNMRAITSAAVICITHKSHEPIKYGFSGTKICSGGRQIFFSMVEKPCMCTLQLAQQKCGRRFPVFLVFSVDRVYLI